MVICQRCNGKGHIVDPVGTLFMTVIAIPLLVFEKDNPNGITRKKCPLCEGKKFLDLDKRIL